MRLLQFSTSHYCRKVRLILGYKNLDYQVENLTPGAHLLRVKPLTGLNTVPVLLPEKEGHPLAIGDSTTIWHYLEAYYPNPSLILVDPTLQRQAKLLEDWLDESIGVAVRFVYYHYRSTIPNMPLYNRILGKAVRQKYNINHYTVEQAKSRLLLVGEQLSNWREQPFLLGESCSIADITASALLSPLINIPDYAEEWGWIFDRIKFIHQLCHVNL